MEDEQPIDVACQSCGFNLRVRQKGAGKTVKCPGCSLPVKVPIPHPTPPAPISPNEATDETLSWINNHQPQIPNVSQHPSTSEESRSPAFPTTQPSLAASPQSATTNAYAPILRTSGDMAARLPSVRNYPVLVIYAKVSRIIGYVMLLVAVIFVLVTFIIAVTISTQSDEGAGLAMLAWVTTSLWVGVVAIFAAGVLIMNAEIIELSMHIQSNTLATAHSVRSLKQ